MTVTLPPAVQAAAERAAAREGLTLDRFIVHAIVEKTARVMTGTGAATPPGREPPPDTRHGNGTRHGIARGNGRDGA